MVTSALEKPELGDMMEVVWWGASLDTVIKEDLSDKVTREP